MNKASHNHSAAPEQKFFYGYIIAIVILVLMTVCWGIYFSFGVFFKPILNEFGWNRAITSGAFSLATIVLGVMGIVTGRLTDRFGCRAVVMIGGIIMGLGYALTATIDSVWQMYLLQGIVVGVGSSSQFVPLSTTISRWFIRRRRLMTGFVLAGIGIGMLIAPPVIEKLISGFGWRMTYVILGIVILVISVAGGWFLKRDPAELGLLPDGELVKQGQTVRADVTGLSLKEAAHTTHFWIVGGFFFCLGFYRLTMFTHLMPHATDLGISAISAAAIMSTAGLFNIIGRVVMGFYADKFGDRRNFMICFITLVVAILFLVPADQEWMIYLYAGIFGFAHAGAGSSEAPLIAGLFGLRSMGLIYGVMSLFLTLGGAAGPYLTGYIYDITGGYQSAFLILAALAAVATFLIWLLPASKDKRTGK